MAYCPRCREDRPITRHLLQGRCPLCHAFDGRHEAECSAQVDGIIDVCTFCHEPVAAKARTRSEHEEQRLRERKAAVRVADRAYREALRSLDDYEADKIKPWKTAVWLSPTLGAMTSAAMISNLGWIMWGTLVFLAFGAVGVGAHLVATRLEDARNRRAVARWRQQMMLETGGDSDDDD